MGKRRILRGGYTVEAAILLPLGIGLILFCISVSLLLHDRVAVCAWIHETAQWEGFQKREKDSRDFSLAVLLSQAKEQVIYNDKEIVIECEGSGQFLSPIVKIFFALRNPRVEREEQVKLIYGEEAVRLRGFSEGVYTSGSDLQKGTGS